MIANPEVAGNVVASMAGENHLRARVVALLADMAPQAAAELLTAGARQEHPYGVGDILAATDQRWAAAVLAAIITTDPAGTAQVVVSMGSDNHLRARVVALLAEMTPQAVAELLIAAAQKRYPGQIERVWDTLLAMGKRRAAAVLAAIITTDTAAAGLMVADLGTHYSTRPLAPLLADMDPQAVAELLTAGAKYNSHAVGDILEAMDKGRAAAVLAIMIATDTAATGRVVASMAGDNHLRARAVALLDAMTPQVAADLLTVDAQDGNPGNVGNILAAMGIARAAAVLAEMATTHLAVAQEVAAAMNKQHSYMLGSMRRTMARAHPAAHAALG
jgi:hypothetical protein